MYQLSTSTYGWHFLGCLYPNPLCGNQYHISCQNKDAQNKAKGDISLGSVMSLGVTQPQDHDNASANHTIVDTPNILFHGNTLYVSETDDLHALLPSTYPASATSSCDYAPTAASGRPCPCHSV